MVGIPQRSIPKIYIKRHGKRRHFKGSRQTFRVLILQVYSIPAVKGNYSDFICSLWFQLLSVPRAYWPRLTYSDLKQTLTSTWLYHITNSDAGTLELSSRVKRNSVIYDVCFSSFDVYLRRRMGALHPCSVAVPP